MDEDDVYAMLKERKSKKNPRSKGGRGASSGGKGKGMSEEEKRAAIRAGLARKKECERRALGIVERMIETGVDREWLRTSVGNSPQGAEYKSNFQYHLFQQCPMIHLSHYQDATEERAVSGLCGYPLCDASIDAAARDTTQKYHISMKDNKVS